MSAHVERLVPHLLKEIQVRNTAPPSLPFPSLPLRIMLFFIFVAHIVASCARELRDLFVSRFTIVVDCQVDYIAPRYLFFILFRPGLRERRVLCIFLLFFL